MRRFCESILPWILLGAGLALCLIGVLTGDAAAVFKKAVTVCLECIGIG